MLITGHIYIQWIYVLRTIANRNLLGFVAFVGWSI